MTVTQNNMPMNKGIFIHNDSQRVFFTSDTHFGHNNIIKYCSRPFSSTEEMDEQLINNWNSVVRPQDIVFHLGDFGFSNITRIKSILDRLNGAIYLVEGNHDFHMLTDEVRARFAAINSQMKINVNGQKIYLNHYPFLCFAGAYGDGIAKPSIWQLFGHVHSGKHQTTGLDISRLNVLLPTQYDVGVDNNNYTPISFNKVAEIIKEQQLSLNLFRGHGDE